ncbi:phosphatidylinositol-3,5-bisphosphate 3-phosphatase MTMR4-like isoform X3 [Callithrix jacchus]
MSLTARVSCSMLSCFGEEGPPAWSTSKPRICSPPQGTSEGGGGESSVLQGEGVEFLGRAADALIAICNYQLHIKFKDYVINMESRSVTRLE